MVPEKSKTQILISIFADIDIEENEVGSANKNRNCNSTCHRGMARIAHIDRHSRPYDSGAPHDSNNNRGHHHVAERGLPFVGNLDSHLCVDALHDKRL